MNIYDTVNKLGYELKHCEEYLNYKKVKEEIKEQPELKQKLEKFEIIRYQIQLSTIQGIEQDKEKAKEMQELYLELIRKWYDEKIFWFGTKI